MASSVKNSEKEVVSLRAVFAGLALIAVGFGVVWTGVYYADDKRIWCKVLAETAKAVGATLVAAGAISFVWDVFVKRSFASEILHLASISRSLQNAGIETVVENYITDVDWDGVWASTSQLDIWISYGSTWRKTLAAKLSELDDTILKVRLLLPDPDHPQVIGELARRYNKDESAMKADIREAAKDFTTIFPKAFAKKRLEIYYVPRAPLYTAYLADRKGVIAMYNHRQTRGSVPIFTVAKRGSFYRFARADIEALVKEGKLVPAPRQA